jgi:2-polyprenyl-3-methyl-5-hydroxy-6-metoxy-1,4-benzoquinol methylase
MKPLTEFYAGLHATDKNYSAGTYHFKSLFSLRVLEQWLQSKAGRPFRILDVGCGKGLFLREFVGTLKSRWKLVPERVTGLDLVRSPEDIFAQISDKFEFIQHDTDGNALPFSERAFDFVCCNHVLEHVFETEKLVKEFRRVIDPEGLCLISVPNLASWINRVSLIFGIQPLGTEVGTESITYGFRPERFHPHLSRFKPSGHIRDFTPRALQDLTAACGFRAVGWWPQSEGYIARLSKFAGRNIGILLQPAGSWK